VGPLVGNVLEQCCNQGVTPDTSECSGKKKYEGKKKEREKGKGELCI
jgi:hypothetical protein